jgi:hypothetical protein
MRVATMAIGAVTLAALTALRRRSFALRSRVATVHVVVAGLFNIVSFTILTPFVPPENFPPSIVRLLRPLTLIAGGVSVAAVKSSTRRLPLAPLVFGITVEVTVPEKKTVSPAAGVLLAL